MVPLRTGPSVRCALLTTCKVESKQLNRKATCPPAPMSTWMALEAAAAVALLAGRRAALLVGGSVLTIWVAVPSCSQSPHSCSPSPRVGRG